MKGARRTRGRPSKTDSSKGPRNRPYGLLARFYEDVLGGFDVAGMNKAAREKILGAELDRVG
jgi:hypothetical protein